MADKTYEELLPQCLDILLGGGKFWAKFTCKHCGARQTSMEPNVFHTSYQCEECGEISEIDHYGLIALIPAEAFQSLGMMR